MKSTKRVFSIIGLGLLLITLTSCGGTSAGSASSDSGESFVVADFFATPGKQIATVVLSATPVPSATTENFPTPTPAPTLPLPTVVILQQPTQEIIAAGPTPTRAIDAPQPTATTTPTVINCPAPPPPFDAAYQQVVSIRGFIGCPQGSPLVFQAAYQPFQHGVMLWRSDTGTIFVISNLAIQQGQETDQWWQIGDVSGGDETPAGDLAPPEGLFRPVSGFGLAWENNAFVREALGWGTAEEIGYNIIWMRFERGMMFTTPTESPVYALAHGGDETSSSGISLGFYPR